MRVTHPAVPQLAPEALARRLDSGEPVQVLDVRAPERLTAGRVTLGAKLAFRNLKGSTLYAMATLDGLGLDTGAPVAVICGHGNSSQRATRFLMEHGVTAFSVTGGMAAWEQVLMPRPLAAPSGMSHLIQVDRVGKGALSYVLGSDGEAVVIDAARHLEPYEAIFRESKLSPRAVIDTHAHADYVSGARAAAQRWGVPYFLHSADSRSPYDGTPGRLDVRPVGDGDVIAFGKTSLRVEHTPGHTLGSVTLVAAGEGGPAFTGDFIFVRSVGRPDLGGRATEWGPILWQTLERSRSWPADRLILPGHYAAENERAADRSVSAPLDAVRRENPALTIRTEREFLDWVSRTPPPPDTYRSIKLANLGLLELSDADIDILEAGANQCAAG
ncbi:MAG TPA: MBL fold metallo-hydrolase [Gemmatimonadales bacterium]|nr:MBL fold metallo-hydrolase [Gemmatimonadales bacterium]